MSKEDDRFAYKTMASIVHKQDRRNVTKDEPTGESQRLTTAELRNEMGAALKSSKSTTKTESKKRKQATTLSVTTAASSNYDELLRLGGSYEPTTKMTERIWETYLTLISALMPNAERDVLRSAAEESLNILKNDELNTKTRRVEMEKLLDCKIHTDEEFHSLLTNAEQLTDFILQGGGASRPNTRKEESGIAIVFDESSGDEKGGGEDHDELEAEVVSVASEDEGEDSNVRATTTTTTTAAAAMEEMDSDWIDPITIDAFWLQRELAQTMEDAGEVQTLAEEILSLFASLDVSQMENHLVSLLGFDKLDLAKKLLKNRTAIYLCVRLNRAKTEAERDAIRAEMQVVAPRIWVQLTGGAANQASSDQRVVAVEQETTTTQTTTSGRIVPSGRVLDLNTLSRLNPLQQQRNAEVLLPKGSWRRTTKAFEEVHVQPLKAKEAVEGELVPIGTLPSWMRPAFAGMEMLNRVQSKVLPAILSPDRFNMLVSAPTSSGKTNIAMLAILNEMSQFADEHGVLNIGKMKEGMKLVYVAPMKALVQEVVANFSSRLSKPEFGIVVRELTGDSQLSRQQIEETQILVVTPEKWDIITRKSGERSFLSLVKLMIVDEIHLLNDVRGAVLEALIARTLYVNEQAGASNGCRILGVSATLPNYVDVASFLRVPLDRGLFYFDNSYRPIPLHQMFIGVTDQKALNRSKQMDQVCFDKVCAAAKTSQQTLVFVHSRKDTFRIAKLLQERAQEADLLQLFLPQSIASREILQTDEVKSTELKSVIIYGIAIHHAGMTRQDRTLVEDMFAAGHIRILVSTATLAWGVNLPAHTVIIRGTQVYNPEAAAWKELPQLDLLQMLGRAGRPQFDTEGEGVVITTFQEMQFYLSLVNNQLPVESSLLGKLPEHINAEVVIGNVSNLKDAIRWLHFTYLHVRAKQVPSRYGVQDEDFTQWECDVCHAALLVLERKGLLHYDHKTFQVLGTSLGRIASHYYLSPDTVSNFVKVLDPNACNWVDMIRILTVADEFKNIAVRHEEKLELAKLIDRVPVPIKEGLEDASTKVNILLQAYISNWSLDGYCLRCDLVFIHQSASRLARALFEICLFKRWANATLTCLGVCLSLDRKLWKSQSPLRQFATRVDLLDEDVLRQLERKAITFTRFRDLSVAELAAMVKNGTRQLGQMLHQTIRKLPKMEMEARAHTLSRTSMRVDVNLTCDFQFDEELLGCSSLLFWLLVMDTDGNDLFHAEPFVLKSRFTSEDHSVALILTDLPEPMPLFLLVKLVSDRYLHSTADVAIPIHTLVLPKKSLPFSELLDLSPIQVSSLKPMERTFFDKQEISAFWPSQTQCYSLLMENTDSNVFVSMPIGKTLLAELAMLRCYQADKGCRIVYLHAVEAACDVKYEKWHTLFETWKVAKLHGFDVNADLKALEESNLVVCSARTFEMLSRRWKQKSRKVLHELSLVVADDMQLGYVHMEVCLSRIRYMCVHLNRPIRIVGLSAPTLNAEDMASWLGNAKLVSLPPSARPFPTEITVLGFNDHHFETRQGLMVRPAFRAVRAMFQDQQPQHKAFVFLPSKKHVRLCLIDFIQLLQAEDVSPGALPTTATAMDATLRSAMMHGMGVLHESMSPFDLDLVQTSPSCRVILISTKAVWKMRDEFRCSQVVVMGTTWFTNRKYEDYPLSLVNKLLNKASEGRSSTQTLFCYEPTKSVLKKGLTQGAFLESELHLHASDVLLQEICTSKTVETKQDAVDFFTWTLFYRRLLKNPSYYNTHFTSSSSFLSEVVDMAVTELKDAACLEGEEEAKLTPTSLGMISSFHDVKFTTMELFSQSVVSPELNLSRVFELVSSASEFVGSVTLRPREETSLQALARNAQCVSLPIPGAEGFTESHVKVNVLLQSWCNNRTRMLSLDQREDLNDLILPEVPKLLHALVDLASSHGWLRACLLCLEVAQSVIQQVWQTETVMKQIPHFHELSTNMTSCRSVYDLIEMEDEARESLFKGLDSSKVQDIARFCNAYPSVRVSYHVLVDEVEVKAQQQGGAWVVPQSFTLLVTFERDEEEEAEDVDMVVSQNFPCPKTNLWWAILGDGDDALLAIKRVSNKQAKLTVDFASGVGTKHLKLFVMCDSYLGADQSFTFQVEVQE